MRLRQLIKVFTQGAYIQVYGNYGAWDGYVDFNTIDNELTPLLTEKVIELYYTVRDGQFYYIIETDI